LCLFYQYLLLLAVCLHFQAYFLRRRLVLCQYNLDGVPVSLWVVWACMSYRHWAAKLKRLALTA